LEKNNALVVAVRMEMLNWIRAFEAERSVLHEELARLKQRLNDADHHALQGDFRQQQARLPVQ
jgi:hypothetical protein